MNVQQEKQQKGFTIIEVILVLAIAALIFLMVFIALPALQRGQRDTARKQDVGDVASAITNYTSNNQGQFPTASSYTKDSSSTFAKYIFGGDKVVSGNTTTVVVESANHGTGGGTDGQIEVWPGGKCGADGAVTAGTAKSTAITTRIETGGGTPFCQDS